MTQVNEYKRTLFDKHGPDASLILSSIGYGIFVAGTTCGALVLQLGFSFKFVVIGLIAGGSVACVPYFFAQGVGGAVRRVWADGASTPYREQYSYQQALVMQGKVDEALASFVSLVRERPNDADLRIRAAELCAREKRDYVRAADFFRDAQRIPSITLGEEVHVTNRLVDLYAGPLNAPGRALVELRRLIDRHPGSPAASNARIAIGALKARAESSAANAEG
ncbi:MAG TPA: hypothetical protein VGM50_15955 [Gemmatimonadaceae bacterium]|jgi:hypothetical protein